MTFWFFWRGSEEELVNFLTFLNSQHTTIKFTGEWRTNGKSVKASWCYETSTLKLVSKPLEPGIKNNSIDFLDFTIWIDENGVIQTTLFIKDCTKVTYLLPSFCHPGHITKNIPYSLGYRLKRICSRPDDYKFNLQKFKENLMKRKYHEKVIDDAFSRLNNIEREAALMKVERRKNKNRPVLAVTYDPRHLID